MQKLNAFAAPQNKCQISLNWIVFLFLQVMQKSTPLSQLPNMNFQPQPNQSFAPPPQQQPSAQQAANQLDILNENAATIQDALDSLNMDAPQQPPQQIEQFEYDPSSYPEMLADFQQQQLLQQQPMSSTPDVDMKSKLINDVLSWNNDLKNAVFATAFFIFLHLIPIEKYIYKYVALDKIPHSHVLVKALLMFIAMLVISKLI